MNSEPRGVTAKPVGLGDERHDAMHLAVVDTGIDISPEHLPLLFTLTLPAADVNIDKLSIV